MPVPVLTARGAWAERVEGADADDFLAKPFQMGELVARVRAQIRRIAGQAAPRRSRDDVHDALGDGADGGGRLDQRGSAGLGLAIVQDIATAWGGSLELDDAAPGLEARLVLPAAK